jgi:predicted GTPase
VDEIYSQKEIEVERILSKFSHVKQKFSSDLGHIYQKYISRTLSVNILVVGKTGIGKSSKKLFLLLNSSKQL